jgi:glycosyltransferase involved in cell wall biosynthesis
VKILVYSPAFLPAIGGLELNVAHLAEGLASLGHDVVVITTTADTVTDAGTLYRVVRRPNPLAFLRWARWCDVFFQHNVSLRGLWPLAVVRRPWVVAHHSWYCRTDGRIAWQDRLKRRLLGLAAASIAVSKAVAEDLAIRSVVIENAYRSRLFRRLPDVIRDRQLLFAGRLVSDKGVDVLLEAMALLGEQGLRPHLTVAGDGPDRGPLARLAERLGLSLQVSFVGTKVGEDLVRLMNAHRVVVVPSRYNEPFGIVALEGIACGCVVVGSEGGGLKGAIGPGGFTFPNGDTEKLASTLARALDVTASEPWPLTPAIAAHLDSHSSGEVLARYASILERAAKRQADIDDTTARKRRPGWGRSSY